MPIFILYVEKRSQEWRGAGSGEFSGRRRRRGLTSQENGDRRLGRRRMDSTMMEVTCGMPDAVSALGPRDEESGWGMRCPL